MSSKRNPSNDRIKLREMGNSQINNRNNNYSQSIDRIMIERGGYFDQSSNNKYDESQHGNLMFDTQNPNFGEITGDAFEHDIIDRGLPMRGQSTKKKQEYNQNDHLDFDLFESKPTTLKVTSFDPTSMNNLGLSGFADIATSTTNISTQLSPTALCSTQIEKLGNNLFYFLYELYDNSYIINSFGLFEIFGGLYFGCSEISEIEMKKIFEFPKKEDLFNGLSKIQGFVNLVESNINFKNFMVIGQDVPYDPKFHDTIKDFCTLVRVDTTKPFSESKKLNDAIKTIVGSELRNTITPENLEKLQLMLLTTCVIHPIWTSPFDKITNSMFYTFGQETKMKFLHSINKTYSYFEDNEHQLLEIKCSNDELSMGFILHKTQINANVDNAKLHFFISHLKECIMDEVKIPMFESSCKLRFNSTLQNIGLNSIFNKLVCPRFFPEHVVLQDVVQNIKITIDDSFIQTNTKETKNYKSGRKFICNKPFIYYFRLAISNTILLVGLFQ